MNTNKQIVARIFIEGVGACLSGKVAAYQVIKPLHKNGCGHISKVHVSLHTVV